MSFVLGLDDFEHELDVLDLLRWVLLTCLGLWSDSSRQRERFGEVILADNLVTLATLCVVIVIVHPIVLVCTNWV